MNVGFLEIQYSFGLQQNSITLSILFLNADPDQLPILNLAGPMTGLIIQPIIGALSDRTWSPKWGRRAFFLPEPLPAVLLYCLCHSARPCGWRPPLLWILDAGNNTAMEPTGLLLQINCRKNNIRWVFKPSLFTGLGITLAAVSPTIFATIIGSGKSATGIPYWVYGSFIVGSIISISTVSWSLLRL